MQILTINTTAHHACMSGDLHTADKLLTQDIGAGVNDYKSYASRSSVKARNSNWDCTLDDSFNVRCTVPS
jgi:hypothetical protein